MQLYWKPFNWNLYEEIINSQSCETPNLKILGIFESPKINIHFNVVLMEKSII
jgi:hypothetical protein